MTSRRQLTYEMKMSLVDQIRTNPHQSTKDLQRFFFERYNWEICQTTLSCILKKEGLGIKKLGGKGRNSTVNSNIYHHQQQAQQYQPPQQHHQYQHYAAPAPQQALPSINTFFSMSAPTSPNSRGSPSTSPKGSYKIYNTDILCNPEDEEESTQRYAATVSEAYAPHHHHHQASAQRNSNSPPTPPNQPFGLVMSSPPQQQRQQVYLSPLQLPPDYQPQYPHQGYTPHHHQQPAPAPAPAPVAVPARATTPATSQNSIRSDFYDINIINPDVKRFRPSSQYQQLEKVVLKLACDIHRQHMYATPDQQQQQQQQPPSPPTSPSASAGVNKSEMVKSIKKEILTSPQYQDIQKPIYLNQFIHKCLKRYQFTNELISRLQEASSP